MSVMPDPPVTPSCDPVARVCSKEGEKIWSTNFAKYREYVEGGIGERQRYEEPMAIKQMFIGDEQLS
jgi:hypothetical protein